VALAGGEDEAEGIDAERCGEGGVFESGIAADFEPDHFTDPKKQAYRSG
jgi:hypothetical protein